VLVIPSILLAHGERRAPITVSFAASDPYLRQRSPSLPPPAALPAARLTVSFLMALFHWSSAACPSLAPSPCTPVQTWRRWPSAFAPGHSCSRATRARLVSQTESSRWPGCPCAARWSTRPHSPGYCPRQCGASTYCRQRIFAALAGHLRSGLLSASRRPLTRLRWNAGRQMPGRRKHRARGALRCSCSRFWTACAVAGPTLSAEAALACGGHRKGAIGVRPPLFAPTEEPELSGCTRASRGCIVRDNMLVFTCPALGPSRVPLI